MLTELDGVVMILDLVGKERKGGGWKRRGSQAMEAKLKHGTSPERSGYPLLGG